MQWARLCLVSLSCRATVAYHATLLVAVGPRASVSRRKLGRRCSFGFQSFKNASRCRLFASDPARQNEHASSISGTPIVTDNDDDETIHDRSARIELAAKAFTHWAKKGKSWKRLGPLVELALPRWLREFPAQEHVTAIAAAAAATSTDCTTSTIIKKRGTVADIGTDHGLLAVALAVSGEFEQVVGIDISEQALRDGAYTLLEEITNYQKQKQQQQQQQQQQQHAMTPLLPVEFRHGNALEALVRGEADTICIAGMGVHTMIEILTTNSSVTTEAVPQRPVDTDDSIASIASLQQQQQPRQQPGQQLLLDVLDCQRLVLQPTNSRPHLLTYLYDSLYSLGWTVAEERIEYLSSRWYLSAAFERATKDVPLHRLGLLPGSILAQSANSTTRHEWSQWARHHASWIRQDAAQMSQEWRDEDKRWMASADAFDIVGGSNYASSSDEAT